MQELSLHILDIAQNALRAEATQIDIRVEICSKEDRLQIIVQDNGAGMSHDALPLAADPFYTTRKQRSIGLGLSLLQMSAVMTQGSFSLESALGSGTKVTACYGLTHIDRAPMGDLAATVTAVLQSGQCDLTLYYMVDGAQFWFESREVPNAFERGASAYVYRYIREKIHNCNQENPLYY